MTGHTDKVSPGASETGEDLGRAVVPSRSDRSPALDEKKRILRERAIKLARPPAEVDSSQEVVELIEFRLAHEPYGVEVGLVREVYPLKEFTPVPCTPSFVVGILNIRGQIISLTDIKRFFDLPKTEITEQTRVIVLSNHKMELGVLADAVVGERKVFRSDIQTDVPILTGARQRYIKGVTKDRLVVMDAEKLLMDDDIIVHEEVGE